MDFRAIKPDDVSWRVSGTNVYANLPDGRRPTFQMPKCPCLVTRQGKGMMRVDARLDPADPVHAAFADWVSHIEENAHGAPWNSGLGLSRAVYNWNFRLMAFSDTLTFDEEGKLSTDFVSARQMTALMDLSGAWKTDSKWGLRWRVSQIKFDRAAPPEKPRTFEGSEDLPKILTKPPVAAKAECMFIDDD
jgi:hypothetical protein